MAARKPKPTIVTTKEFVSESEGISDMVKFHVSSEGTPTFTIENTENYCLLCNEGCFDSEPECANGSCECMCTCENESLASVQLTVEQSIEMFRAIRAAFAAVGDPQLHIIEEELNAIIVAA
jgi:hypothetical protein